MIANGYGVFGECDENVLKLIMIAQFCECTKNLNCMLCELYLSKPVVKENGNSVFFLIGTPIIFYFIMNGHIHSLYHPWKHMLS